MSKRITEREFFTKSAEVVAQWLIGKIICRKIDESTILRYRITETEAYCHNDTATHSNQYKTGNAVECHNMIGGTIYVHYRNNDYPGSMFDIVSNEVNINEGVLIRGADNVDDCEISIRSQPRILGEALYIDYEKFNKSDILNNDELWIEDDGNQYEVIAKKRIGLDTSKNTSKSDKEKCCNYSLKR